MEINKKKNDYQNKVYDHCQKNDQLQEHRI
jgi:hypothetical protein